MAKKGNLNKKNNQDFEIGKYLLTISALSGAVVLFMYNITVNISKNGITENIPSMIAWIQTFTWVSGLAVLGSLGFMAYGYTKSIKKSLLTLLGLVVIFILILICSNLIWN